MVIERPETRTGELDKPMLCPQVQGGRRDSDERAAAFSCRQPPSCLGERHTQLLCSPTHQHGQWATPQRNNQAEARAYGAEAYDMLSYNLGWWGSELPGQKWPRKVKPGPQPPLMTGNLSTETPAGTSHLLRPGRHLRDPQRERVLQ